MGGCDDQRRAMRHGIFLWYLLSFSFFAYTVPEPVTVTPEERRGFGGGGMKEAWLFIFWYWCGL